ncbi:helix-turn-helix domain-containing protein [Paucibacter sp. M5-1]|uniref:helix-turn-helix domain-containing protein n=1 Tax=Paucibacter sp. M5-1 TaxID=3015998 RepID=UPI0022B9383F|nr:helix-turn-helix domain-containing protein [Paucibacter sp. M5-1]MCZ7883796.1 helix-turn-helix domain-containing protein [Paucibacter sp. M5-1]
MTAPQHTPADRIAALHAIRDRNPGLVAAAQRTRLLEALQTLGYVTTFEGSRFLDCYDVRARKMELVNAGHRVIMNWIVTETEAGVRHRIGQYTLVKGKA